MKKFTLLIHVILAISFLSHGQNRQIDSIIGHTREIYTLDSENRMNGNYMFYFYRLIQVQGSYQSGLKTGKWIYQPDSQYKIIGYYKADIKDSLWNYFLDGKLFHTYNYRTGESRTFYPNGDLKSKGDSTGNKYLYEEYFSWDKLKLSVVSDSTMAHIMEFDRSGEIIEDIWFKNNIPYNINLAAKKDRNYLYEGEIKDGNGRLFVKYKNPSSASYYVGEKATIKDSKLDGPFTDYDLNTSIETRGFYLNGFMSDKWIKFDMKTGKVISESYYYVEDSLTFDKVKKSGFTSDQDFYLTGEFPVFGWYQNGVTEYMELNLKYPKQARKANTGGRVLVQFVINSVGKVTNIKLVKGVDEVLDREVLTIVRRMPYWRPGMLKGKAVSVSYTLPVSFKP